MKVLLEVGRVERCIRKLGGSYMYDKKRDFGYSGDLIYHS